jgi:hypothetical protein
VSKGAWPAFLVEAAAGKRGQLRSDHLRKESLKNGRKMFILGCCSVNAFGRCKTRGKDAAL